MAYPSDFGLHLWDVEYQWAIGIKRTKMVGGKTEEEARQSFEIRNPGKTIVSITKRIYHASTNVKSNNVSKDNTQSQ